MAERTAVLGVGQTKYQTTRGDVSLPGLVREAAYRALEDAEVGWDDIDAVVVGKAPDFFEGGHAARAVLGRGSGGGGQAAAAGPHRRIGGRVYRSGGRLAGASGHPPPGAHPGIREAVGVQRHLGAVVAPAVLGVDQRRGQAATSRPSSASTWPAPTPPS